MTKTVTLLYSVEINAPQNVTFDYLSEWDKQSEWIALTNVKKVSDGSNQLDTQLHAWTGIGPIGFLDTMIITEWKPPHKCTVKHTGKFVKGYGIFSVNVISESKSEFVWEEVTPIPLGFLGRFGFFICKPLINIMFNRSLRKLKSNIEKLK